MASSSSFAGGGSTEEDGVPYSALEDIGHLEERSVLCRHLVRTLLGSLCESVFALLQAKGKLSLRDILQHRPELPYPTVRSVLLVLISHEAVFFKEECPVGNKLVTLYETNEEAVVLWQHHGTFLRLARDIVNEQNGDGALCVELMQQVLLFGWIPRSECILYARTKLEAEGLPSDGLEEVFSMMARLHLIAAHHRGTTKVSMRRNNSTVAPSGGLKGRGASVKFSSAATTASSAAAPSSIAAGKRGARPPAAKAARGKRGSKAGKASRKRVLEDEDVAEQEDLALKRSKLDGGVSSDSMAASAAASASEEPAAEEETLWTVNPGTLLRRWRNEKISEFCEVRLPQNVDVAMTAILSFSSRMESSANDSISSSLSISGIFDRELRQEGKLSLVAFESLIDHLCDPKLRFLERGGAGSIRICYHNILHAMKMHHVENMILQKHGTLGRRLFCMICECRQLEQKQITEMALASPRNVRLKLYEMLRTRTLCLQDVPRMADHNPQKTIYTWFVNVREVMRTWKAMVYKGLLNMRLRLEREQKWGLDKFPPGFRADPTEEQQQFLQKLEPREQKLNTVTTRVAEMLAIMDDFKS